MPTAIKVENLSKAYQLGEIGTGTISRDLERYWAKLRGKDDPFLKIGETNDRSVKSTSNVVWSLKDLDFEIAQGDAVGVIGRNGAGKSTLLKILSRVTAPTTGSVKIKGRIASLLEVGTGFHPDLTGRENIFLNGAILGMRKAEIKLKFDEIVDFSGIERYIDTPVKRYSSGMYVRLAFAVAAHLESEILIVDEVLAVGDAEFQKKCLGKMGDVSKGEGRTILFVSHNMIALQKLCKSGILLNNGLFSYQGQVNTTIEKYLDQNKKQALETFELLHNASAEITKVGVYNLNDLSIAEVSIGGPWQIKIEFVVHQVIPNVVTAVGIGDIYGYPLKTTWQPAKTLEPGTYVASFIENKTNLALGKYHVIVSVSKGRETIQYMENVISFDIVEGTGSVSSDLVKIDSTTGVIIDQMNCSIEKIK